MFDQPYLTECANTCRNQMAMTSSVCSTHLNRRLEYEEAGRNYAQSLKFAGRKPDQVNWHGGECM